MFNFSTKIALVGNGPVQPYDYELINKQKEVFYFNDAKSYKLNSSINFRVVRSFGKGYWGVHGSSPLKKLNHIPLILVGNATLQPKNIPIYQKIYIPDVIFQQCDYCKNNSYCMTESASWGPSTGVFFIDFLLRESNSTIHIFGMNFLRPSNSRHMVYEKQIVEKCCTRCVFHKTSRNTYYRKF